ncbi:hypothetical protein H0Z60_09920 [Ectothiorhodospiraceae bacterium WFHF3C12]|nr:hypothetical protein [Ectothiorhodospiraceae bacterium WFHF3C12]
MDDWIIPSGIRVRSGMSFDRSKYATPDETKARAGTGWTVCGIAVIDLPKQPPRNESPDTWLFELVHDPCDDNYSHSEYRGYKNGSFSREDKLPRTIKNSLREYFAGKFRILAA